jgi:hypothetical protein
MSPTGYFWWSGAEPTLLGASTTQSGAMRISKLIFWNRHLTNNDVWVFFHEIKEPSCKLIFVICRLYIYIVSSMLLVYMDVLREPFLPQCKWRDSSCATLMFFGLEGYTELVFLALWLEFVGLLFSDEIFDIFNHSSNIRVWSDQLSIVIYTRPALDPVSHA